MSDRELLELAAKAAGVPISRFYDEDGFHVFYDKKPLVGDDRWYWNPLTDDGDALRLAVKLKIDLSMYNGGVSTVWVDEDISESHETWEACDEKFDGWGAKHSATRRAIVRAAAAIGKVKP